MGEQARKLYGHCGSCAPAATAGHRRRSARDALRPIPQARKGGVNPRPTTDHGASTRFSHGSSDRGHNRDTIATDEKTLLKLINHALKVSLLLVLAGPVAAQPEARALLDDFASELDSLSAEFSQITIDASDEVVEESSGRMFFQKPDLIRWDYIEPFPQVIVADGEQLWHYDESLEQVTVRPQPAPGDSPMLVLTRPELLEKFYRILPSDRPDQLRFEPLADQAEIEMARLTFRDGKPATLDLFDPFGQSTRLTLTEIRRNPEIDPGVFEFEVPEGADVLEGL